MVDVQFMPVFRTSRSGIEQDIFLRQPSVGQNRLRRDELYCEWFTEQMRASDAVEVVGTSLHSFRLVRQLRRARSATGVRSAAQLIRPQAEVRSEIIVKEPDLFARLLARGIGRHTAFGYGMLLLRPPS